jgi:hypothetical protein
MSLLFKKKCCCEEPCTPGGAFWVIPASCNTVSFNISLNPGFSVWVRILIEVSVDNGATWSTVYDDPSPTDGLYGPYQPASLPALFRVTYFDEYDAVTDRTCQYEIAATWNPGWSIVWGTPDNSHDCYFKLTWTLSGAPCTIFRQFMQASNTVDGFAPLNIADPASYTLENAADGTARNNLNGLGLEGTPPYSVFWRLAVLCSGSGQVYYTCPVEVELCLQPAVSSDMYTYPTAIIFAGYTLDRMPPDDTDRWLYQVENDCSLPTLDAVVYFENCVWNASLNSYVWDETCDNLLSSELLWSGKKACGDGPVGTYTRTGGSSTDPTREVQ